MDARSNGSDASAMDPISPQRQRLVALAYRMTGSQAEAEDIVQDAWLRWAGANHAEIRNPGAWATTVVTRLSLDRLRAQTVRRNRHIGPWLPEFERTPITELPDPSSPPDGAPLQQALRLDSVRVEVLVVLDRLSPVERAVIVLADAMELPFSEIATIVERSETACRQLVSRARKRLREQGIPEAYAPPNAMHWQKAGELLGALANGDLVQVMQLLSNDVVLVSDAGGKVRAATREVFSPWRVGRWLTNITKRLDIVSAVPTTWNGSPGLDIKTSDNIRTLMCFEFEDVTSQIRRVWIQRDPDKLTAT
jgi:RNA polymerase sigma-70 factor, ECF subfamily